MKQWMKRLNPRPAAGRLWAAIRERQGQIAYYACVALALIAIAVAAERYRGGEDRRQDAALPAVEFSTPAPEEEAPARPFIPEGWVILRGYSDAPVWNEALGLWESHPATDVRPDGEALCLCAGTVRGVGESGALGGYVEVESGELILCYASIAPREGLKPGDELDVGDTIGAADASLPGEAVLGPHLHLEARLNGRAVDFETIIAGD